MPLPWYASALSIKPPYVKELPQGAVASCCPTGPSLPALVCSCLCSSAVELVDEVLPLMTASLFSCVCAMAASTPVRARCPEGKWESGVGSICQWKS